jgi:hypothetical protein
MNGCKENYDKGKSHIRKGPFEIYVLCNQLYTGFGNALVDTGSQVSFVKESGLMRDQALSVASHTFRVSPATPCNLKVKLN